MLLPELCIFSFLKVVLVWLLLFVVRKDVGVESSIVVLVVVAEAVATLPPTRLRMSGCSGMVKCVFVLWWNNGARRVAGQSNAQLLRVSDGMEAMQC